MAFYIGEPTQQKAELKKKSKPCARRATRATRQEAKPAIALLAAHDNLAMAKLAPNDASATCAYSVVSKLSLDYQAGAAAGVKEIARIADRALDELLSLAKDGRPAVAAGAARALQDVLSVCVSSFSELCEKNPALFAPIARKCFRWPGMLNRHPERKRKNEALIEKLDLAAESEIEFSGKSFSFEKPANLVVLSLYGLAKSLTPGAKIIVFGQVKTESQSQRLARWITDVGCNLPPLNKATASEWAKQTTELFELYYGSDFEESPLLRELRSSVEPHANDYNTGKQGQRGLIRNAIRKAVAQAWQGIARNGPTTSARRRGK